MALICIPIIFSILTEYKIDEFFGEWVGVGTVDTGRVWTCIQSSSTKLLCNGNSVHVNETSGELTFAGITRGTYDHSNSILWEDGDEWQRKGI